MVADRLAEDEGVSWTVNPEKTKICSFRIESRSVTLVKPQTYMNLSGKAVAPVIRRVYADPAEMIVVHDDMDLAMGRIRIKTGGGDGGHKGIRSIADSLRFRDFIRIRLGVGRPPPGVQPENFVLSPFLPDEEESASDLIIRGARAVLLVVRHGMDQARNMIHAAAGPDH
jgi:peptidyl-tRNA hydrolase, PTH1 family